MTTKREIEAWRAMAKWDSALLVTAIEISIEDAYRIGRSIDPRRIAAIRGKNIAINITAALLNMAEMLEEIGGDRNVTP